MSNGYRTLSQHLNDLKKENFSLKLRIYFLEERIQQKYEESSEDVYRTVSRTPLIKCEEISGNLTGCCSGDKGCYTDNKETEKSVSLICWGISHWVDNQSEWSCALSHCYHDNIQPCYAWEILSHLQCLLTQLLCHWCDLPCVCFTECVFVDVAALLMATHLQALCLWASMGSNRHSRAPKFKL